MGSVEQTMKNFLYSLFIGLFGIAALTSIAFLLMYAAQSKQQAHLYSDLAAVRKQDTQQETASEPEKQASYQNLYWENTDMVGWILIEDTNIDYPVMQTPTDPTYYLKHDFEKNQIGSSAMAYKRNPMRSERIGSLSRYVMVDVLNGYFTTATQWFERTLDDSANKRLSVPEAFLAVDGILSLYANVADGLVVYPKVIEQRLRKELPFMATENIMMDAVKKRGADRQQLHERIREHSMAASRVVKVEGGENDLLERIAADEAFGVTIEELEHILKPENYTGRAKEQTEDFLNECIKPVLEKYADVESDKPEINV